MVPDLFRGSLIAKMTKYEFPSMWWGTEHIPRILFTYNSKKSFRRLFLTGNPLKMNLKCFFFFSRGNLVPLILSVSSSTQMLLCRCPLHSDGWNQLCHLTAALCSSSSERKCKLLPKKAGSIGLGAFRQCERMAVFRVVDNAWEFAQNQDRLRYLKAVS